MYSLNKIIFPYNLLGLEFSVIYFLKFAVVPTQIVFGYGGASTTMKSYGAPKGGSASSATNGIVSFNVLFLFSC